jgi:hypothetical protein
MLIPAMLFKKELSRDTKRTSMADESIRNGNGVGLLIMPDLILFFPIVYHFLEALSVIEEDVAGAAAASVDLAALHLVGVAVLVALATHHH